MADEEDCDRAKNKERRNNIGDDLESSDGEYDDCVEGGRGDAPQMRSGVGDLHEIGIASAAVNVSQNNGNAVYVEDKERSNAADVDQHKYSAADLNQNNSNNAEFDDEEEWTCSAPQASYSASATTGSLGWDYTGPEGAGKWHLKYPQCAGRMQSPIDIQTSAVLYDPNLQPFDLGQYQLTFGIQMVLENYHGLTGTPIIIRGGSLPDEYVVAQFHFHWGEKNDEGSEHTVDSQAAPLELHIVHHMSLYKNISQAVSRPYGLAVLGLLFKIGESNKNLDGLLGYFPQIIQKDANVAITPFPLYNLLPEKSTAYYRYFGSLTTPPCYETVIWTLFSERIEISQYQLEMFRSLRTEIKDENGKVTEVPIGRDFRPPQQLQERRVYASDVSIVPNIPLCTQSSSDHRPDMVTVVVAVSAALSWPSHGFANIAGP